LIALGEAAEGSEQFQLNISALRFSLEVVVTEWNPLTTFGLTAVGFPTAERPGGSARPARLNSPADGK